MNISHYDWKSNQQSCPACGWAGLGSETVVGESFSEGVDYHCPACDHRFGFVAFPLLKESLSDPRAPKSDRQFAEFVMRGVRSGERSAVERAAAAPSLTRTVRMLVRYSAWANDRLFAALAALPDGAATATRLTGFGTMVNTLNHAHVVDLIWKAHLEGKPHGFTARITDTEPALAALREAQAEVDRWYIACADGLTDAQHDEVLHFRFVDGGAGAMTRGDMLLHVVNHKTYHRGYVADMLYQAGARPPAMDLPVFLRDEPQGW